jgi:hypothetical protein
MLLRGAKHLLLESQIGAILSARFQAENLLLPDGRYLWAASPTVEVMGKVGRQIKERFCGESFGHIKAAKAAHSDR